MGCAAVAVAPYLMLSGDVSRLASGAAAFASHSPAAHVIPPVATGVVIVSGYCPVVLRDMLAALWPG
jgi:hypothetical protein